MIFVVPQEKIEFNPVALSGDKSISHRLVLFSVLLNGTINADNLSDCEDVNRSISAVKKLGVCVRCDGTKTVLNNSHRVSSLHKNIEIDCGNSGTTARLLMGVLAGKDISCVLKGDQSLSRRNMTDVISSLSSMGVHFDCKNNRLPLLIRGAKKLKSASFYNSKPSAQLKSAQALAGIQTDGLTSICEKYPTRNHTELLLREFKADIRFSSNKILIGKSLINGDFSFSVPADPSSAAYIAAAGLLFRADRLIFKNMLLNELRSGFFDALKQMSVVIKASNVQNRWEKSADIELSEGKIRPLCFDSTTIPTLIDEIPILAVLMSKAKGVSVVRGAQSLRNKETDRIKVIIREFSKAGIECGEFDDGFWIRGPSEIKSEVVFEPENDHRLFMSFFVLGMLSKQGVYIKSVDSLRISFPSFLEYFSNCYKIIQK